MELLGSDAFRAWAAEGEIVPHPRFDQSAWLVFRDAPEDAWRRWDTPRVASDLPGFVSALMEAAAPNGPFVLAVRDLEPWFTGTGYDEGPLVEQLRDRIVGTLPIPRDFVGALRFEVNEWRDVQMVMLTFLVYGWCIADDLELLSGDRSCVLMTSHHGYVAARCRDAQRLAQFEGAMSAARFAARDGEAADIAADAG